MALTCSNCGKELPDNARFCGDCGTLVEVQEQKPDYCANCFAELPEGIKFCLQCGKPAVIARHNFPRPESNKAIREELHTTSPTQVKFHNRQAIYKTTGEYPIGREWDERIEDFEQNRAILVDRARQWAEYSTSDLVERIHWFQDFYSSGNISYEISGAFGLESFWFPTNKPNHHKTLFYEEFTNYYLYKLIQQGVLTYDDPQQPTALFFDYLRKVESWTDEDIKKFTCKLPDMEEIRAWAAKDDELFPPSQPLRIEVANAILNFMTDEGVLVVYTDCSHAGERIQISFDNPGISLAYGIDRCQAVIMERSGSDTTICAAIFNHIPFVTDELKNRQEVMQQLQVIVKFTASGNQKREETVTILPSEVAEIDWRGTPQSKAQPQQATTRATSTTGVTVLVTRVERRVNKYVYYMELVDPGYIEGAYNPEPLTVELEPEDAISSSGSLSSRATSSSDAAIAVKSSDADPNRRQQKVRKPIRSNWK